MSKITGIKKAVGRYQSIKIKPWYMPKFYGVIMIDIETSEVWCNIFLDSNTWKHYVKKSIRCINRSDEWNLSGYSDVNMKNIKRVADEMVKNYENAPDGYPAERGTK